MTDFSPLSGTRLEHVKRFLAFQRMDRSLDISETSLRASLELIDAIAEEASGQLGAEIDADVRLVHLELLARLSDEKSALYERLATMPAARNISQSKVRFHLDRADLGRQGRP